MPSATFDKSSYSPGDTAVVTVDYPDVPDGQLVFAGTLTPGGGGTPIPLNVSAPVKAQVSGIIRRDSTALAVMRADNPAASRVMFSVTV